MKKTAKIVSLGNKCSSSAANNSNSSSANSDIEQKKKPAVNVIPLKNIFILRYIVIFYQLILIQK